MNRRTTALVCAVLGAAFFPAASTAATVDPYRKCMALARSDPEKGFGEAVSWEELGGGAAAKHCAAVALNGLGEHGEAARRLEALAQELNAPAEVRIDLLAQAAQAWLLADDAGRAESVLNAAIAMAPADPRLYIDRAEATAAEQRYADAEADLDRALRLNPDDADALALRAGARRHLGNLDGALLDAEEALQLVPDHLGALLERGILRRLAGDPAGAREDWLRILELAPHGAAASVARARLEDMDVRSQ